MNSSQPDQAELAIAEYLEKKQRGLAVCPDEILSRFPEKIDEIRSIIEAIEAVELNKQHSQSQANHRHQAPVFDSLVGQQLGDYRIIREIGRGGMGVVYEACQESLGRQVALKILPHVLSGGSDSAGSLERFQREAQAAARLHHSNIVPVFEVDREGDRCFYAMQYIEGLGLDAIIERLSRSGTTYESPFDCVRQHLSGDLADSGNLEAETSKIDLNRNATTSQSGRHKLYLAIAGIGMQVANALEYAHSRATIHRDIKPSNLILDGEQTVWIADFGLAKTDQEAITQTGDLLGTWRYMSPERFKGQCDSRSDIYALGMTLYELATLKPAFEFSDRMHLLDQIAKQEPPSPGDLVPGFPLDLETIILKAADKLPDRRYQTAGEMAEDLRRFANGEPIIARRATAWERLTKWVRRQPVTAALVALVIGLAIVSTTGILWQWRNAVIARNVADDEKQVAIQFRNAAEWEAYRSDMRFVSEARRVNDPRARDIIAKHRHSRFGDWELGYFLNVLQPDYHAHGQAHGPFRMSLVSPDGKRLLTSNLDGHLHIWDTHTKKLLTTLKTGQPIEHARFSNNSNFVAALTRKALVTLRLQDNEWLVSSMPWEGATLEAIEANGLRYFLFSDDAETLGILHSDKVVLIDTRQKKESGSFPCDYQEGSNFCWFPDQERVLAREQVFDLQGELLARLTTAGGATNVTAIDPQGKYIALANREPNHLGHTSVSIFDAASYELRYVLPAFATDPVESLHFRDDGEILVMLGGRSFRVWSLGEEPNGVQANTNDNAGIRSRITELIFEDDQQTILLGTEDGSIGVYDYQSESWHPPLIPEFTPLLPQPPTVTISGVRSLQKITQMDELVELDMNGVLRFWNLPAAFEREPVQRHNSYVYDAKFLNDSQHATSFGFGEAVRFWPVADPQRFESFPVHENSRAFANSSEWPITAILMNTGLVEIIDRQGERLARIPAKSDDDQGRVRFTGNCSLSFHPDGKLLAIPMRLHGVGLIDCESATGPFRLESIDTGETRVSNVAFDPAGTRLAIGGSLGDVAVCDLDTPSHYRLLGRHVRSVNAVAWSPCGTWIGSASLDSTVKIWDANTGQEVASMQHRSEVRDLAFHPGGKRLATGCRDGAIRIWDLERFEEVAAIYEHQDYVNRLEFSADGRTLLSASGDKTVRVWQSDPTP